MILNHNYYVIVFDVCSSSVILQSLQNSGRLKIWRKFWKKIFQFINKAAFFQGRSKTYKFVGDGFIILCYPSTKSELLQFCDSLIKTANEKLLEIVTQNDIHPNRLGITIGIAKGPLISMRLFGNKEYMGEAINVASRLQSQLKQDDDKNNILVSQEVYTDLLPEITAQNRTCVKTDRILHNLNNNEQTTCYQIKPSESAD